MFRATIVVLTALFAMSSCAEQTPEDSMEDTRGSQVKKHKKAQPPAGAVKGWKIKGTGYTFRAPEGWGPPRQTMPGPDPDSFAMSLRDRDGFSDNVSVALAPGGSLILSEVETSVVRELRAFGAKNIRVQPRETIAGSSAAHISATTSLNGVSYTVEQFYLSRSGQNYVLTFSFSGNLSALERYLVMEPSLESWSWAR